MKKESSINVEFGLENFCCPHCGIVAHQTWSNTEQFSNQFFKILQFQCYEYRPHVDEYQSDAIINFLQYFVQQYEEQEFNFISPQFHFSVCSSCKETSVWFNEQLIYPRITSLPEPNIDLNTEAKEVYIEASHIFQDSPRASAALLRLCLEILCHQLEEKGKLISCIGSLSKKGKLNNHILRALDYCRVIGNHAVHAGEIDLKDNTKVVETLFYLVNDIANELLTKPREMNERYSSLTKIAEKHIEE